MKIVLISKDDPFKIACKEFFESEGYLFESHSKINTFSSLRHQFIILDQDHFSAQENAILKNSYKSGLLSNHFMILSHNKEEQAKLSMMFIGADEIVNKPISHEYLLTRVRSYFTKISLSNDNRDVIKDEYEDAKFYSLLSNIAFLRNEVQGSKVIAQEQISDIVSQISQYLTSNTPILKHDKLSQEKLADVMKKSWGITMHIPSQHIRLNVDAKYFIYALNNLIRSMLSIGIANDRISIKAELDNSIYKLCINLQMIDAYEAKKLGEILSMDCWRNILSLNSIDYRIQKSSDDNHSIEMTIPFQLY